MKPFENFETVVHQLEQALEHDKFPAELHQWGSQLALHLRKPVQVAVIGAPQSGKSALINMMLGQVVVPQLGDVSVIEIASGPDYRALFETVDGSIIRVNGMLADATVPAGAIRARQELPGRGLSDKNFVEIGLAGSFGQQKSIVNWVSQWADIILWCTDSFGEDERKLWSVVPEDTKDHSCLVMTKADQQLMRGVLSDQIEQLQDVVAEEFLGLYPIATLQAIAARIDGEDVNDTLWQSSGGKELLDCVLRQVHLGRTADLDQAEMLLMQLPATATTADMAAAKPQASKADSPGTPEPAVLKDQPEEARPDTADIPPDQVYADALELLQDCADDLFGQLVKDEAPVPDKILGRCVDATKSLSEILANADPNNQMISSLQSDAEEGTEMMLLLRLEKGEDAAEDAVTLLLQLKKEISQISSTLSADNGGLAAIEPNFDHNVRPIF